MLSCAPPSIENRLLMLWCARTRNSRWRNDVSSRSPVNSPRTAISNRSRPIVERIPERSRYDATVRASHSFAFFAVQGASSGTCFDIRSILNCASAIVTDRERADLRDQSGVTTGPVAVDEEVRALHPRLVGGDADLGRERRARRRGTARATRRRGRRACRRRGAASRSGRRRGRALRGRRPTCRPGSAAAPR